MGKNEKMKPGRALVKHHNQMIQQSKEKGRFYNSLHKKVLESITEVSDIDAVLEQAEEDDRLFSLQHPAPNLPISLFVSFFLSIIDEFMVFTVNLFMWVIPSLGCLSRDASSSARDKDMTLEERREQRKKEEALHASSLRVPRMHFAFSSLNLCSVGGGGSVLICFFSFYL